jgi:acid phosphatase
VNHVQRDKFLIIAAAAALIFSGCSSKIAGESPGNPVQGQNNQTEPKPAENGNGAIAPAPTKSPAIQTPESTAANQIDHVVVVIEENHSYNQIVGNQQAPYFNELIAEGALFTNSHGVTHPSQPNYLALFSGSTQGVKDDSCGKTFDTASLASELIQQKLTFTGYSEDLPKPGFTGCSSKGYARKHNPWTQFANLTAELNQPFTSFPEDYSHLPTVSFVVPNHQNDMHDGTVQEADTWMKEHLQSYVSWAQSHRSLFIVTWDEDDNSKVNRIPTIFVGPMVKQGKYDESINHYNVLRTIEDLYHLVPLGESAKATSLIHILS